MRQTTPHKQQEQQQQASAQLQPQQQPQSVSAATTPTSSTEKSKQRLRRLAQNVGLTVALLLVQVAMYRGVIPQTNDDDDNVHNNGIVRFPKDFDSADEASSSVTIATTTTSLATTLTMRNGNGTTSLPLGFQNILERARYHYEYCRNQNFTQNPSPPATFKSPKASPYNETIHASLPPNGILQALTAWKLSTFKHPQQLPQQDEHRHHYQCQLPPETECQETQVTVIFMAHKPDNLDLMVYNLHQRLVDPSWQSLIKEIILVYNGPSQAFKEWQQQDRKGQKFQRLTTTDPPTRFRIFYALDHPGFSNHLMNRYHPQLQVSTKAILYYDDDGPFYSYNVTRAAFELWKRNANVQVGALGRILDIASARQKQQRDAQLLGQRLSQRDKIFISHCTSSSDYNKNNNNNKKKNRNDDHDHDRIIYNYKLFPNFGAHMVLPSSSFLHVNYLCFVWHPALTELRQFVASHPVFPDDIAVSLLVSQLSGRAPRTYPFRLRSTNNKLNNSTAGGSGGGKAKGQSKRKKKLSNKGAWNSHIDDENVSSTSLFQGTRAKEPTDSSVVQPKQQQQQQSTKTAAKETTITETTMKDKTVLRIKPDSSNTKIRRHRRLLGLSIDEAEYYGDATSATFDEEWHALVVEDEEDGDDDDEDLGIDNAATQSAADGQHQDHNPKLQPWQPNPIERQRRRRLLWEDVPKHVWSGRRSHAANHLVAYFGSIHAAGGFGWCMGSQQYQQGMGTCVPEVAEVGMLPWMNKDNTPKSTCP